MKTCSPKSYPLEATIDMSLHGQRRVKSLTYLVETADSKKPPEFTLGGRYLQNDVALGVYDISTNS
jgi:hypothetical protein